MRFGMFSALALGVLREAVPAIVPGGGSTPVPAPAPPAPAPAPANGGGQPFAVFNTQDQFEQRLQREARSQIRAVTGIEDPAEIKARLDRLTALEAEEENRRRAALSKEEQLQTDLSKANERAMRAEQERDAERFRATVAAECATAGVKNVRYAQFVIGEHRNSLSKDQQAALDVKGYLGELLKADEYKTALGVAVPAPTEVRTPVNTSPNPEGNPPPPARTNGAPPAKSAMEMTDAEWRAHKATLGI